MFKQTPKPWPEKARSQRCLAKKCDKGVRALCNSASGVSSIALLRSAPFQKRRFPQLRIRSATEWAPVICFFVSLSKRHDRRFPQLRIGSVTKAAPVFVSWLALPNETIAVFPNCVSGLLQKRLQSFASSLTFLIDTIAVFPNLGPFRAWAWVHVPLVYYFIYTYTYIYIYINKQIYKNDI